MFIHKKTSVSRLEEVHQSIFEKYKKEKIFFCPYCKCILYDGNYLVKEEDNIIWFRCRNCKSGFFNHSTITEKHSGTKYRLPNKTYSAHDIIEKMIIDLDKEGFSINEIYDITHFSKELIRKKLKNIDEQTYTQALSTFMHERFKIDKSEYDSVEKNHNMGLKNKTIYFEKAFRIGLTYALISSIFRVSKRDVAKILNNYISTLTDHELVQIYTKKKKVKYKKLEKKGSLYIKITYKLHPNYHKIKFQYREKDY